MTRQPKSAFRLFRSLGAPGDTLLTAEIAEASGDDQTAAEAYRHVLSQQPDSPVATSGLIHLMLKEKHYAEAEPLLRSALSRDPDDPVLNSQLASTLTPENNHDEAVGVIEKVHQPEPENAESAAMLADAYTQAGDAAKADPIYVKLLRDSPENPDLLVSRGDNLIRQERYSEAIPVLQKAVRLKPDDGDAWSDLAFAASEMKQNTVTLESLSMRSKYLEETPATYFLRATAYDNSHQTKQAAEYYKKFLQAAHGNFPIRSGRPSMTGC
jgi:Flp pilus assembly protein TadD